MITLEDVNLRLMSIHLLARRREHYNVYLSVASRPATQEKNCGGSRMSCLVLNYDRKENLLTVRLIILEENI